MRLVNEDGILNEDGSKVVQEWEGVCREFIQAHKLCDISDLTLVMMEACSLESARLKIMERICKHKKEKANEEISDRGQGSGTQTQDDQSSISDT